MCFRKNAEQNILKRSTTTKRNKVCDVSLQTKRWVATNVDVNNSNIYFHILITCDCFSVRCSQLPQPPVRLQRLPDSVRCWTVLLLTSLRAQNEASRLQTTGFFQSPSGHDTVNYCFYKSIKVLCNFLLKETACWSSSLLFLLRPLFLTSLSHYS